MNKHVTRATAGLAVTLLLAFSTSCSRPKPPDPNMPPEPQATDPQATELRDAIQQPLDQAEAVKQATEAAADAQRAAIDEATGG